MIFKTSKTDKNCLMMEFQCICELDRMNGWIYEVYLLEDVLESNMDEIVGDV